MRPLEYQKTVRMARSNFPGLPTFPATGSVKIPAQTLRSMIGRTIFAISSEESRYTLNASAAEAINEVLSTFQVAPSWLQNFTQENGDSAGTMIRVSNAISQSILDREKAMNADLQVSLAEVHRELASLSGPAAGSRTGGNPGNGHDYNAQLQTKVVCDELDRCQTVSATIDDWYSDCSGRFYPGPASGGPPPASLSPCWSKGR